MQSEARYLFTSSFAGLRNRAIQGSDTVAYLINHPRVLAALCLVTMWSLASVGVWLRSRMHLHVAEDDDNLSLVVGATLTLLGLIIGFTFSMAGTRYDQRRVYEEAEANAIGTEYVRADLMGPNQAAAAKKLLLQYLDYRIAFYQSPYGQQLRRNDERTTAYQAQLWHSILPAAAGEPTPITALVVAGMNDVLNSQGYTQFAWWNRIPTSAWWLLIAIGLFANLLVGFATKPSRSGKLLLLVLPLVISISFFLISDMDSPRGGVIRVPPRDLISLSQSLHQPPS